MSRVRYPNTNLFSKKFDTEVISDNVTKDLYLKIKIIDSEEVKLESLFFRLNQIMKKWRG